MLLINGIPPPPPLSGTATEELTLGCGLGEKETWRGWNGHGYDGEDDTAPPPPELGVGEAIGGSCGEVVVELELPGGAAAEEEEETLIASFWVSWHVLSIEPLLKAK